MLSDVEIDALYAQIERPFSQEEVARFVRTPESRARRLLEETHYHNYALIELTCSWKEFLAGTAPQPHEELGRLLTPGRNSENAARNRFEALAEFFSKYPHGGVPRFAIIPHALRSSFALIDHLDDLHPTADLTTAREQLRAFTCLVSYKGDPTLRRDAFAERLKDTSAAFLDACTRNAAELSLWISAMLKERESAAARHVRVTPATAEDIQKATEEVKRTVRKAKREIIKDAHTARKSEADRRVPKGKRGAQITAVRKLMREARAAGKRMSILNACRAVWRDVNGGYPSPEALYDYCHSHKDSF